jgi:hypothetical protein
LCLFLEYGEIAFVVRSASVDRCLPKVIYICLLYEVSPVIYICSAIEWRELTGAILGDMFRGFSWTIGIEDILITVLASPLRASIWFLALLTFYSYSIFKEVYRITIMVILELSLCIVERKRRSVRDMLLDKDVHLELVLVVSLCRYN